MVSSSPYFFSPPSSLSSLPSSSSCLSSSSTACKGSPNVCSVSFSFSGSSMSSSCSSSSSSSSSFFSSSSSSSSSLSNSSSSSAVKSPVSTSRVIIRNLPPYILKEETLKNYIYEKAAENANICNANSKNVKDLKILNNFDITDCKIKMTKSGKSRRFAYVGFKDEKIAESFINFFNNTYFHTYKMSLSFALPPNSSLLPKPLSIRTLRKMRRHEKRNEKKTKGSTEISGENYTFLNCAATVKIEKVKEGKAGVNSVRKHFIFLNDDDEKTEKEVKEEVMEEDNKKGQEQKKQKEDGRKKEKKKQKKVNKLAAVAEEEKQKKEIEKEEEEDLEWLLSHCKKKNGDEETSQMDNEKDKGKKNTDNIKKEKKEDELKIKKETTEDNSDIDDFEAYDNNDAAKQRDLFEEDDTAHEKNTIKTEEENNNNAKKKQHLQTNDKRHDKNKTKEKGKEDEEIEEGRIMLLNIPYACQEEELYNLCRQYGEVSSVHICKDEDTHKSKGYAFILYAFTEHAVMAVEKLNNAYFQGRIIQAKYAFCNKKNNIHNNDSIYSHNNTSSSSYKRKKEKQLKEDAYNENIWNLLYVSANAYMNVVTDELNIDKYDMYNFNEKNLAVKQTMSETHILKKTKDWLLQENINVKAFIFKGKKLTTAKCIAENENDENNNTDKKKIMRVEDTIIIKHLPPFPLNKDESEKEEEKLRHMFLRYGEIYKFLMSPSKTVAICKYVHAYSAKNAFKNLCYKNFRNFPLFLEIPTVDVFLDEHEEEKHATDEEDYMNCKNNDNNNLTINNTADKSTHISIKKEQEEEEGEMVKINEEKKLKNKNNNKENIEDKETDDELNESAHTSVFVKNLNFKTSDKTLLSFFQKNCKGCIHAMVMKKKAPIQTNKKGEKTAEAETLSMGYGFIKYEAPKDAIEAIKKMQGAMLEGHSLELKIAKENKNLQPTKSLHFNKTLKNKEITKKILVKNLAFEASKNELMELFSAYGNVQAVRMPKKIDGKSRGYAFVEYLSKAEAIVAMEALQHSHFYGRHLILEPAKDESEKPKICLGQTQNVKKRTEISELHDTQANDGKKKKKI